MVMIHGYQICIYSERYKYIPSMFQIWFGKLSPCWNYRLQHVIKYYTFDLPATMLIKMYSKLTFCCLGYPTTRACKKIVLPHFELNNCINIMHMTCTIQKSYDTFSVSEVLRNHIFLDSAPGLLGPCVE